MIRIDDEIPFETPQGWEWARFSQLYWHLTDGAHLTPRYTESGIPFISVKDMSNGEISFSNTKYISKEEHDILSSRCNPQKGDLLLSKVGTTGIPALVKTDRPFSLFVSVALIKFFPEYLNSNFLIYLINSPLVQDQVKENTRGVGNKNWVLSAISSTIMAIPPINEQNRIVARIEELMPYLTRYEKSQDHLDCLNASVREQLRKSILQDAIKGRLVPQDPAEEPASTLLKSIQDEKHKLLKEGKLKKKDVIDSVIYKGEDNKYYEKVGGKCLDISEEIPFEIPDSWCWLRLSHLITIINGTSYQKGDVVKSGIRILRGGNIQLNRLLLLDDDVFLPDSYRDAEKNIREGDIIIVASTGSPTVIGKPAIVYETEPNIQIGAFLRILRPYFSWSVKYLNLLFTTEYYREHIRIKAKGTNINNIKAGYLNEILVPLPPMDEQRRIIDKVRELFSR